MNKNFFLGMMVLIGLFPSCNRQETDGLHNHETEFVTLTAAMPASVMKARTRALPELPADYQLRCILEVWNETKTVLQQRHEKVYKAGEAGSAFEFSFGVLPGLYQCLLWADYIPASETGTSMNIPNAYTHYADKYYMTDGPNGLQGVSIKDENYTLNTGARDAFFGWYSLNKGSEPIDNVTIPSLSRPFAKLLILEKNAANYACCNTLGATYEVPDDFDVSTGVTSSKYTVNQTNVFPVGNYEAKTQVLFYDYVFSTVNSTLNEIAMTFEGKDSEILNPVTIPANIPLRRNYVTNAAGSLISENTSSDVVSLNVNVSDEWNVLDTEYDIPVWNGLIPPSDLDYKFGKKADGNYGTGAKADPYLISSAIDLAMLSANVTLGTKETYQGKYFEQTSDINLCVGNWQPIGNGTLFRGIYDGKGYSVSYNINALPENNDYYLGLFGQFCGEMKNLNVKGNIVVTVDNIKSLRVGSICGLGREEKITNCSSECNLMIAGTVREDVYVGGLAGRGGGNYYDNSFSGHINTRGVTNAKLYTGGVAGSFFLFKNGILQRNVIPDGMKVMGNCTLQSFILQIDGDTAQEGKPWPVD